VGRAEEDASSPLQRSVLPHEKKQTGEPAETDRLTKTYIGVKHILTPHQLTLSLSNLNSLSAVVLSRGLASKTEQEVQRCLCCCQVPVGESFSSALVAEQQVCGTSVDSVDSGGLAKLVCVCVCRYSWCMDCQCNCCFGKHVTL
jgi:hypothetical protein